MVRDGHGRDSPAEQPPSAATSSNRGLSSHHHRSKKSKLTEITSETENNTVTLNPNSSTTFTPRTHTYTNTRTESYNYSRRSHTKQHHSWNSRRKWGNRKDDRRWTYSPRNFSNYKDRIVLVSYNILGVDNAYNHFYMYRNVPPRFMEWEYRKQQMRRELRKYNAGIMCFQEVDRFDDLANLLEKDGYTGVHQARTGEASDGCAIFWKIDLYTLLHEEGIEYQKLGLRDNVAQFCVFKMNQSGSDTDESTEASQDASSRSFVVGNIHVLFNPGRGDVKLGQMRILLEKAEQLSSEWGSIPVVIAGDFNSMPESPMYQFVTTSELDVRLHDRREISGQINPVYYPDFHSAARYQVNSRPSWYEWSEEELCLATGDESDSLLKHNLKLCSAYAGVPGSLKTRDTLGEPLATSFHSKFLGTVDYIWHTKELVPVRVLETLPVDLLRKTRGLPSQNWGSDHLALACELAFQ